MKKLKWYHYAAKVIMVGISLPLFPLLVIIALSSGSHPLAIYKCMWYDNYSPSTDSYD